MLRKLESKDAARMLEWMHDPKVNGNFRARFGEMTLEDASGFIKCSFTAENQNFAFTNDKDEYLGTISLKNISEKDRNAEYAVVTRRDAQGTGCAYRATLGLLRYAFEELGLHRVYLNVLEENERANRFYLKCGFIYEGMFRGHLFQKNEFRNLKWYGMQKDDYRMLTEKIRDPFAFEPFVPFLRPATASDLDHLPQLCRSREETDRLLVPKGETYILSDGIHRMGAVSIQTDEKHDYRISYALAAGFYSAELQERILLLAEEEAGKLISH